MTNETLINLLYILSRYVHIVATALLVGGTLFYELIVPVAVADLKDEQQLWIFARARWAFRWIVWCCAAALLLSGVVSTYRSWYAYAGPQAALNEPLASFDAAAAPDRAELMHIRGTGLWWLAHTVGGLLGLGVALALVKGRTPPRYPLVWMRINLIVLLVVIFLASTARHVRLRLMEGHMFPPPAGPMD